MSLRHPLTFSHNLITNFFFKDEFNNNLFFFYRGKFFFLKQKHIIHYSIKLASWNKASLAIRGTSSIQYISSEIFLANWANT